MPIACSNCDVTPPTGAIAGAACVGCGERLIESPDPFAALDRVGTLSLDEMPSSPPPTIAAPPIPVDDHDPRFAGPADSEITADQLHIDPRDLADKLPKLAASRTPLAIHKTRKSRAPALVLTLLLLGGLGAGGYYYWFHIRKQPVEYKVYGPGSKPK
jgi:hypothetical protein